MGTRHLVIAVIDGETKVAQYGQWDGYPTGQGARICKFFRDHLQQDIDYNEFVNKLRQIDLMDDERYHDYLKRIDAEKDERFLERNPQFSRDTSSGVLDLIRLSDPQLALHDSIGFASDSLMCEWAYVLDFDKGVMEIYHGFNEQPLAETERFHHMTEVAMEESDGKYYPIRWIGAMPISQLRSTDFDISEVMQEIENKDNPGETEEEVP